MKHVHDRILITGASSGIGRALAVEYAAPGKKLALCSRNAAALEETAALVRAKGGEAFVIPCDVSDSESVQSAFDEALSRLGGIDLAVLNSGIGGAEWITEMNSARIKQVVSVNLFGVLHFLECLVPVMRGQGYGTIAGVSSLADVRGYPGSAAYCASKAALTLFLESARVELAPYNIRVLTVRPGFVRTPMIATNEFTMPFTWEADRAARRIRRGIDKRKKSIRFPFPIVAATWFVRIVPVLLYDWAAVKVRKPK